MTVTTYTLTIDVATADGTALAGKQWTLTALPQSFIASDTFIGLTQLTGTLDSSGQSTVDIVASEGDSFYQLVIEQVGKWSFRMPAEDSNAGDLLPV